jgi:hypothetical protein
MAVTTESKKASVSVVTVSREPQPDDPEFLFNCVKVLGYSERGGREPLIFRSEADTLHGEYSESESSWTFSLPQLTDSVTIMISETAGCLHAYRDLSRQSFARDNRDGNRREWGCFDFLYEMR